VSGAPALDPALALALRLALALLFASAAREKARGLTAFRGAIAGYRLVPEPLVPALAWLLLAVEGALAVGLLAGATAAVAAAAAAALLALYSAAIAVNLARGRGHIDCGCGGPGGARPLGASLLVRNGVLLLACVGAALPAGSRSLVWLDAVTALAAAAALALTYAAADAALSRAARLRRGEVLA
jgi:uncharacterized membrane protein YphA (DoxX/SURF4 family)